jgi:hypothetical protein
MRATAGKDEHAKAGKHPMKWQISAVTYKVQKCEWNRQVGQRNQGIRNNVQPYQSRVPHIAIPMRHEWAGRQKRLQELHRAPRSISLGLRERTQQAKNQERTASRVLAMEQDFY